MGNTPPMNFSFNAPEIEPILFWAHQMFRTTEQRFNEQAAQMDAARKKQAAQLAETKKNQAALMADFRALMVNTGFPTPASVLAPVLPVAFPAPAFTSTVERREIFPKLPTFHGVKVEFQPWYLQARAKLQVDCTHISQRNKFFYIHSKLKDKIFNQVQTWVKVMTERETFSVQGFFNQLIIVYDNFQSMEITVKELNKMKQGNKQSFSAFISGFDKKMLGTGGMEFNDQTTKIYFNNALNHDMHKAFIGLFIPATYTAYCIMFHRMNNQLKVLRSKDWTTTTTVTRVTKSFTTVNSITDDVMDWEPTVNSSFTKMVGREIKWVSPTIITKKKEKGTCFRCGIVGHKVDKCVTSLCYRCVG